MTELQLRHAEIEAIILTEDEIKSALWTAKILKWNKERNKAYWEKLEGKKLCAEKSSEKKPAKTACFRTFLM